MKDLDRLAPDQRAVLSLVLEQDRSYEQVASMLGMSEQAVRDRAHAALDALAHDTHPAVADPALDDRAVVNPALAAEPAYETAPAAVAAPPARNGAGAGAQNGRRSSDAFGAHSTHAAAKRGSRLGGALLLGALAAIVIVAAILISGGGSKGSGQASSRTTASHPSSSKPSASNANSSGAGSSSGASANGETPKLDKTLPLAAVEPSLKAAGVAYVLSQGKRRAFYVKAEGMPPSSGFFYAVWLYDSPSQSAPLGRAPKVTSNGRMEGGGPLPSTAYRYHKIVITRETNLHASQPGEVVLSGAFSLR